MPKYASPQQALLQRCTKPYGPFAIVWLADNQWGVIRDQWLQDPAICHVLFHLPPEQCQPWLLKSNKATSVVLPTLACALLRVISLLEEEVDTVPQHGSALHGAWRLALTDLEHLLDYPEQDGLHAISELKQQVGELVQFPVQKPKEPSPEPG